jgi:hypothetical protein
MYSSVTRRDVEESAALAPVKNKRRIEFPVQFDNKRNVDCQQSLDRVHTMLQDITVPHCDREESNPPIPNMCKMFNVEYPSSFDETMRVKRLLALERAKHTFPQGIQDAMDAQRQLVADKAETVQKKINAILLDCISVAEHAISPDGMRALEVFVKQGGRRPGPGSAPVEGLTKRARQYLNAVFDIDARLDDVGMLMLLISNKYRHLQYPLMNELAGKIENFRDEYYDRMLE